MKQIMIIAGEASGDLHASTLIKSTLCYQPKVKFFGIGGDKMRQAGADIIIDNKELAVVGIFEILRQFKFIRNAFNKIKQLLITDPPHLLILVDYPDFNLRLAKFAHKHGIKVLYFISPQLWAWRQGRIKTIKKCVNKMAVILPFEVDFYQQHSVDAIYVGNPLLNQVHATLDKTQAYEKFNLDPNKITIALLPGSRHSEINHLFATMIESAKLLKQHYPTIQFVIPLASTVDFDQLQQPLHDTELDIKFTQNELYNTLQLCDAAICVSGTVTLEVALMRIPFVIIYKLSTLSFLIGRLLVKIDTIGLCNIIAGKKIVPELIQHQATPEAILAEIIKLLQDKTYNQQMRHELNQVKNKFQDKEACDIGKVISEII